MCYCGVSCQRDFKGMSMNQDKIVTIIEALANGIDPITGEVLPDNSPYNQPEVIRSLFQVTKLIPKAKKSKRTTEQKQQENLEKGLPKNYGLAWLEGDINSVVNQYKSNVTIDDIAEEQARKPSSIIGLLKKRNYNRRASFYLRSKI